MRENAWIRGGIPPGTECLKGREGPELSGTRRFAGRRDMASDAHRINMGTQAGV